MSLLLAFSLIFLGCSGAPEVDEAPISKVKKVPAFLVEKGDFTPVLSFSGTLLPQVESDVLAETSGTISQIFVSEGDRVSAGQTLLAFASGENLAQIDLNNAYIALEDAEKTLVLMKEQVSESEESAQISVNQAQESFDNAKKTQYSTGTSVDAQIAAAQSAKELAILARENAEKVYEELEKTLINNETHLYENKDNAVSNSMATFRKILRDADDLLGVTAESKETNDQYEVYLGFREPQTKIDSDNAFRAIWNTFLELEQKSVESLGSVTIEEMTEAAEGIRTLLQQMDIMLKQSVSGIGLSEAELSGFQTSVTTNRSSLEGTVASLTSAFQQVETFLVSRPQQIRSAELAIEQAQKQLNQSGTSLEQVKSGGDVSLVSGEGQVDSAKNALLSAKTQLDFTRKQNEVSLQQLITARNNALSSLRRAQAQAAKLGASTSLSGIVTRVSVQSGDTVNMGTPLFSVAHLSTLILQGDIDAPLLQKVKVGMPVSIFIDGFEEREGLVSRVYPVADTTTRRIPIEIAVPNTEGSLPANIFARATIALETETDIIQIPQTALFGQSPPSVFLITEKENKKNTLFLEEKEIEGGRSQGDMIEVKSGLLVGQHIVLEPVIGIKNGDYIEIRSE